MATSSIFTKVKIDTTKGAEKFADALTISEKKNITNDKDLNISNALLTDKKDLQKFAERFN